MKNFFKKYKERECKTLIGKFIQRLVFTNIYKICFGIALMVIGGVGMNIMGDGGSDVLYNTFAVLFMIGIGIMVIMALLFFAFAWVINPLRSLKENKRK